MAIAGVGHLQIYRSVVIDENADMFARSEQDWADVAVIHAGSFFGPAAFANSSNFSLT